MLSNTIAFKSFVTTECEAAGDNVDMRKLEQQIKNVQPSTFVREQSSVDLFVKFLCMYGRLGQPKSLINQKVKHLYKTHNPDGSIEGGMPPLNRWEGSTLCFLDFVTKYDLAYTLWQCINSFEDWKTKILRKGMKREATNTRWTKDSKEPCTGGESGVDCYKRLVKWVGQFKSLDREEHGSLDEFRKLVNTKAEEWGFMKEEGGKGHARTTAREEFQNQTATAVKFDLDPDHIDWDGVMEAV